MVLQQKSSCDNSVMDGSLVRGDLRSTASARGWARLCKSRRHCQRSLDDWDVHPRQMSYESTWASQLGQRWHAWAFVRKGWCTASTLMRQVAQDIGNKEASGRAHDKEGRSAIPGSDMISCGHGSINCWVKTEQARTSFLRSNLDSCQQNSLNCFFTCSSSFSTTLSAIASGFRFLTQCGWAGVWNALGWTLVLLCCLCLYFRNSGWHLRHACKLSCGYASWEEQTYVCVRVRKSMLTFLEDHGFAQPVEIQAQKRDARLTPSLAHQGHRTHATCNQIKLVER